MCSFLRIGILSCKKWQYDKKIAVSQNIQYVEVVLQNIPLQKLYAENLKKYEKTEILQIFIYLYILDNFQWIRNQQIQFGVILAITLSAFAQKQNIF
jgi:hypothetical protein